MPADDTTFLGRARDLLHQFDFEGVFNEIGWSQPMSSHPVPVTVGEEEFSLRQIAHLSGVYVFEVTSPDGQLPDAKTRAAVQKQAADRYHENLLIFVDENRTRSIWYWVKHEGTKTSPRDHYYFAGQPGDLFLSNLAAMVVDFADLERHGGNLPLVEVVDRLKKALDVERVTKNFYLEYREKHLAFTEKIRGITKESDRRWYASVLMNRLMFIYFLQRKEFLDGGGQKSLTYLQRKLDESTQRFGADAYYDRFLKPLFFEGFAKPADKRGKDDGERAEHANLLGTIPYLNGGLFLRHRIEQDYTIEIEDSAFRDVFDLFQKYSWNLDDTPGGKADEISPDVLGYIFEKYINQKEFGAYYTRPEITEYLSQQTIQRVILDKVNAVTDIDGVPGARRRRYQDFGDLLTNMDDRVCALLIDHILPNLAILDPACGSGAFLVAAMKALRNVYGLVYGQAAVVGDARLQRIVTDVDSNQRSRDYVFKREIIKNNLYGVDIMEEGAEIAKLRLFLALVSSARTVQELEPLPNIDFNILPGNSLVGLLHITPDDFDKHARLGRDPYGEIVRKTKQAIRNYKDASGYTDDLEKLRDEVTALRTLANETLNDMLLDEFGPTRLKIKYEQATWDATKNAEGKPVKQAVTLGDVEKLEPFHWGFEFDEVMGRGGFDCIITTPPWEIFKPNGKEFFSEYSDLVTRNTMTIGEFEAKRGELLANNEVRAAWLEYQSSFPHVSAYYRSARQYENQISVVNGKKAGTDINLYKLFTEQCFNLLRDSGQCGIVIPSGIYTDLGTKQLREMLFNRCSIRVVFGLSNEKFIFENVHHSFKFCLLTFEKGANTQKFSAAFRINPREAVSKDNLYSFLNTQTEHVTIPVPMVRRLSPDSISITEFRSDTDMQIAEKMLRFPLLGERKEGVWNLSLTREFEITKDNRLFRKSPEEGYSPLFTGKMFNQFARTNEHSGYWINTERGRATLLGRTPDQGQLLDYQQYRWVHRRIARNTDSRTLISTIAPKNVFTEVNSTTLKIMSSGIKTSEMLYLCSVANSLVLDWNLRQKITTTLNMFYIYQLPVPRLTESSSAFRFLVERAAKLICTTPEYDDLAHEVGLRDHTEGVTDAAGRAQLRAEMDGRIAHLYGLTEDEFTHILATFPLVPQSAKDAAIDAYRAYADLASQEADDTTAADEAVLRARIASGESGTQEFKVAALWNPWRGAADDSMRDNVLQAVAAFLNSPDGGTVFVGVADDGTVVGVEQDIAHANRRDPSRDGYALWLANCLHDALTPQAATLFYNVSLPVLDGKPLCCIDVRPCTEPVYLRGDLYVRSGPGKRKLNAQESWTYIRHRWPEIAGRPRPSDAPLDPSGGLFGNQTMLTMETPNTDNEAP